MSLSKGVVPLSWKHANIIPLPKDGNKKDVNNLRPISLLPLPGKILEKIIQRKLSNYLEAFELLDPKQGGFRQKHSTIDTTVNFTEDIYKNMNDREVTVAVYVDLRKLLIRLIIKSYLKNFKNGGTPEIYLNGFKITCQTVANPR